MFRGASLIAEGLTLLKHLPSFTHKSLPSLLKNRAISPQHTEQLLSYTKENNLIDSALYGAYLSRFTDENTATADESFPTIGVLVTSTGAVSSALSKKGIGSDEDTLAKIAYHCSQCSIYDAALQCSREMLNHSTTPSQRTRAFNIELYVHALRGDDSALAKTLALLEAEKLADTDTYHALVVGYARHGNFSSALSALAKMQSSGLVVDNLTHCVLLESSVLREDLAVCEKVLTDMRTVGLRPELSTYLQLIDAFAAKRYEWSLRLVEEMKEIGLEPPFSAYLNLVDVWWGERKIPAAVRGMVIAQLKKDNLVGQAFLEVIEKYEREGKWQVGMTMMMDLKSRREQLTKELYAKLMDYAERKGDMQMSSRTLWVAKADGFHPEVSSELYFWYYDQINYDICARLVKAMQESGQAVAPEVYETFVEIKASKNVQVATETLEQLAKQGIASAKACDVVIQQWYKKKRLDMCEKIFADMRTRGVTPLLTTVHTMMAVFGKKKQMDMCNRLWAEADEEQRRHLRSAMIFASSKCGDARTAFQLYEEAKRQNATLDDAAYAGLVTLQGNYKDLCGVVRLYEEALTKGLEHGEKLKNAVLSAFVAQGCLHTPRRPGQPALMQVLETHRQHSGVLRFLAEVKALS